MKTRTASKVARLKKAPGKGRWGAKRHYESFVMRVAKNRLRNKVAKSSRALNRA